MVAMLSIVSCFLLWAFGLTASSNLYLTTYYDISKWWVALIVSDDVDNGCKDTIDTIYIKDNVNYANEWVPHYAILTSNNDQEFYEWDMLSNGIFSLPISIKVSNASHTATKYNLITTFDAYTQFNFGDEFCSGSISTPSPTPGTPTYNPAPEPSPEPSIEPSHEPSHEPSSGMIK